MEGKEEKENEVSHCRGQRDGGKEEKRMKTELEERKKRE